MVKIRFLKSGLTRELADYTPCNDMGGRTIRISEAKIGELVLISIDEISKDSVAEILEIISTPRPDADERDEPENSDGNRKSRNGTTFSEAME